MSDYAFGKHRPKSCKRCKTRLPKPAYGHPFLNETLTKEFRFEWPRSDSPIRGRVWFMKCSKCQTVYVWSFHAELSGCWKIRSDMPLFDTKEMVG